MRLNYSIVKFLKVPVTSDSHFFYFCIFVENYTLSIFEGHFVELEVAISQNVISFVGDRERKRLSGEDGVNDQI